MRRGAKGLVALFFLLAAAGQAATQQDIAAQPILRYGHVFCPLENVEELDYILDSPTALQRDAAIQIAVYFGKCKGPFEFTFSIANLEERKSPGGKPYACFDRLDPRDGKVAERSCAMAEHVTTIGAALKTRKGDYDITEDSARTLRAHCREGGDIMLMRDPASWYRASLLFARLPEPLVRAVDPDLARVLRDGCLGVDYLNK